MNTQQLHNVIEARKALAGFFAHTDVEFAGVDAGSRRTAESRLMEKLDAQSELAHKALLFAWESAGYMARRALSTSGAIYFGSRVQFCEAYLRAMEVAAEQ